MSSLSPLEKLTIKFEKNGFKKEQKKTLKFGSKVFMVNKKGLRGTDEARYIYYTELDVTTDSIREFLKDFEKVAEEDEYELKGIFLCTKKCDSKIFRDLKQAMIKSNSIRKSINLLNAEEPAKEKITSQPKENRDIRRAFTQTQKNEILFQQDNKCAECYKKLDPRAIEYDHKEPWASGGRTLTINGRALCASCHKIVTHRHRLKQVDK